MIPFTIASKIIKYLRLNLTKEVKDLYTKIYKILVKEIDTHNLKSTLYSWITKINIIKMSILPKSIYRFNVISIKILMAFFMEVETTIIIFIRTKKDPKEPKNPEKEEQNGKYHTS